MSNIQTLLKGTGTPYVSLFDGSSQPIVDPSTGTPLGTFLKSFSYTFETGIDESEVVLQVPTPSITSLPSLQYCMPIILQWGWLGPEGIVIASSPRRMMVTNHKISFNTEGVKFSLELKDPAYLVKKLPPSYGGMSDGLMGYMTSLLKGIPVNFQILYWEKPQPLLNRTVAIKKSAVDSGDYLLSIDEAGDAIATKQNKPTVLDTNKGKNPYQEILTPTESGKEGLTDVIYLDYSKNQKFITGKEKDLKNFMITNENQTLANTQSVVLTPNHSGTRTSRYNQIKDVGRSMVGGPWYLTSDNGNLILQNTMAAQDTWDKYEYAKGNGELLEFDIKTDYSTSIVEAARSTDIDADTKDVVSTTVQATTDLSKFTQNKIEFHKEGKPKISFSETLKMMESIAKGAQPTIPQQVSEESLEVEYTDKKFNSSTDRDSYITSLSNSTQVTQEMVEGVLVNMDKKYQTINSETDSEKALQLAMTSVNEIDDFVIKQKVKVRYSDNIKDVFDKYGSELAKKHYKDRKSSVQRDASLYDYLNNPNNVPGLTVINDYKTLVENGGKIDYYMDEIIEIPISAQRILSACSNFAPNILMGNDLVESTTNQIKASAKILGRPNVTDNLNMEFTIEGSPYSGVWCTEKVEHSIEAGSYICELTLKPKVIPTSKVIFDSVIHTKKVLQNLSAASDESVKTGTYTNMISTISTVTEVYTDILKDTDEDLNFRVTLNSPTSIDVVRKADEDNKKSNTMPAGRYPFTEPKYHSRRTIGSKDFYNK